LCYFDLSTTLFIETTQIWGKEFPGDISNVARELLFFSRSHHDCQRDLCLSQPSPQLAAEDLAAKATQPCAQRIFEITLAPARWRTLPDSALPSVIHFHHFRVRGLARMLYAVRQGGS
jgi:hypothetical protein